MKIKKGVFIVWRKFQRRVEVLAPYLDLEIHYFYYPWEERSKILKALSYIPKSIGTLKFLFQKRPSLVFIQFPPTPALYCVAFYSLLTGSRFVSDCHFDVTIENWLNWFYAKKLLRQGIIIIHNEHVTEHVIRTIGKNPIVVRDGIAKIRSEEMDGSKLLKSFALSPKNYVIVPWSFSSDEPFSELIEAVKSLPEFKFVMTWHLEKIPKAIRNNLPSNMILTGYLQIDDFNSLFSNSGVALVLTEEEAIQLSGMQEAMAFEVAAVVSDLNTTRFLYKNYPVFVRNDPKSIADGVKFAFQNRPELEENMRRLRIKSEKEFSDQVLNLRSMLTAGEM